MPLLLPVPQPVYFEEVAANLHEAPLETSGGPPYMIVPAGLHLAVALNAAGFHAVRVCKSGV